MSSPRSIPRCRCCWCATPKRRSAGAEAQLANATAEEARQRPLVERNITPQAQYDAVVQSREAAAANMTRARTSLQRAKDQLSYTKLRADFDGVVTATWLEQGQVVNVGQKIMTIARPEIREAVIAVPPSLADQLAAGEKFDVVGRARPDDQDQGDRRARRRSGGRRRHPHAQRLSQPRQSAGCLSARHHRPGDLEQAGLAANRPAGDGAAGAGRQGQVWIVDPATRKVALRDVAVVARDGGRVSVTGLAAGDRSSPSACTAWRPASEVEAVSRFNLSEWALGHRSFVWYLMLAVVLAGVLSYAKLGREEDPAFTIKTMIVQANWPGATVEDMTNQVTDRIERKLQELASLDYTKSYTTPGQTTIFVNLKDDTRGRDIPAIWVQVRNRVSDIRAELPQGVQGPFFNDQFGDVFGNIYAFTADGLSFRQLRDYVERVRTEVLKIPNAGRVELLGTQDEVIYLDFSTQHVAGLGLDQQAVLQSLQAQNAVAPSGVVQAGPQRVSLRVSGQFTSEESLRAINIRVRDRFFRLADVVTISRGYVDPPQPMFRYNGQPAIGLAIGMKPNGNLVQFGEDLRTRMREIVVGPADRRRRPPGVEPAGGGRGSGRRIHQGSGRSLDHRAGRELPQPRLPRRPRRRDPIPLVLAGTFLFMEYPVSRCSGSRWAR